MPGTRPGTVPSRLVIVAHARYHPHNMTDSSTSEGSVVPACHPAGWASRTTRRDMLVLGLLTLIVALACYFFLDQRLMWSARAMPQFWKELAQYVTKLGDGTVYLLGLPVLALIFGRLNKPRAMGWALLAWAAAGSCLIVHVPKIICGRYRPSALKATGDYGFAWFKVGYKFASFPSGHAMTAAAMCTVLWLIWPRWWMLWLSLGILVSASRIFTNSHYLSDVLVGGYMGVLITLLIHALFIRSNRWTLYPD